MTSASKWSIAQRLGGGFALLFLILASFVGLIAWQLAQNDQASKTVDAAMSEAQRIEEFENAVLLLAISTRDVLREQTPQHRDAFAQAQQLLDSKARALDSGVGGAVLAPLAAQYASASRASVNNGDVSPPDLTTLRQALLAHSRTIVEEHDAQGASALERMRTNRQTATVALIAGAVVTGVLFLVIAYLTTRSVSRPARALVAIAEALRAGDWKPAQQLSTEDALPGTTSANEITQIGRAFGAAAAALEIRELRLEAHAAIAKASGASLDGSQIAEAVLRILLQQVQAEVGALFVEQAGTGVLVPLATRCVSGTLTPVRTGEGLVGQCAQDLDMVVWRNIPPDSPFSVSLGNENGNAPPRSVAAIPLVFSGGLLGVLVVASLREFQDQALSFLKVTASQIAVGLKNANAHEKVQQLFVELQSQNDQVQAQNEELQAQNEEIQAQNEELQAQSEEIQAQHEELQAQTEEIQAQNEDLQRQAAQLHEQTHALLEADAHKNDFLGLLAHELRNPLTPIVNCIELLGRHSDDHTAAGRIEDILGRQVRHMTHLIDDLLDVTRVNRGKVTLKRQKLDLTELVNQCLGDQQSAMVQAGLVLAVSLPEVPIYVDGDHTRICQILSNLLGNAIKFCEVGCTISVKMTLNPPERSVSIHVADTGPGMEPAVLSRLFEPFYQGETDLARTKGGLGLGLALAKGLVELHGGKIAVHSDGKGLGAEFVVSFPLAVTAEHPTAAHDGTEPSSTPHQTLSVRVLVVDDNADAANSLAELLQFDDFQVEVAYTAHIGMEAAIRFDPDVILCDIGMPFMDGYAFAREVREHPQLSRALLVALTGYSLPTDQLRANEAGFAMLIPKPPDYERILEVLRSAAAAQHLRESLTPGETT